MFAEAVNESARRFHDDITVSAYLVSSSEQKRREIRWQADTGRPFNVTEIITKDQRIAALEREVAELRGLNETRINAAGDIS